MEGVEIEGKGVYFHLEGVYSNIYMYVYVCIHIYIYYYTPLPLNLANNKQQQQQATSNTSPCRFSHCTFPSPPA